MMEVRTVLVTLLSRFWFDLAPSMGGGDGVRKRMQMALTLKIAGGLRLLCRPHAAPKQHQQQHQQPQQQHQALTTNLVNLLGLFAASP